MPVPEFFYAMFLRFPPLFIIAHLHLLKSESDDCGVLGLKNLCPIAAWRPGVERVAFES
jgi:hypothetical protein